MTKSMLAVLALSLLAVPVLADPKAPREDGKGNLKPGQAVGVRKCLASAKGINIDATSKKTIGVANCKLAIQKVFLEDKKLCEGQPARTKIAYAWQFGEGEYATTGKHYVACK